MNRTDIARAKFAKLITAIIYEMTAERKNLSDVNITRLMRLYNCSTVTRQQIEEVILCSDIANILFEAAENLRKSRVEYVRESRERTILINGVRKKLPRQSKELSLPFRP